MHTDENNINAALKKLHLLGLSAVATNDWAVIFRDKNKFGFINVNMPNGYIKAQYNTSYTLNNFIIMYKDVVTSSGRLNSEPSIFVKDSIKNTLGPLKTLSMRREWFGISNEVLFGVGLSGAGYLVNYAGKRMKLDLGKLHRPVQFKMEDDNTYLIYTTNYYMDDTYGVDTRRPIVLRVDKDLNILVDNRIWYS